MIYGQVVSRQIRPPVLVLVGELLAGRLGDEHNRHALRSVALREVGALGRHAHVMAPEQLLDPSGLLHGKARSLDLVQLLVLLVVERGDAVRHRDRAVNLRLMRGHCLECAALEAVERIAEIQREVRLAVLHIEREGPGADLDAAGQRPDVLPYPAVGLHGVEHQLHGHLDSRDGVDGADRVLGRVLEHPWLGVIDAGHDTEAHGLLGVRFAVIIQELGRPRRHEFPFHRGEEIVAQELLGVACEVLLQIDRLEGGQCLGGSVVLGPERERAQGMAALAHVILDNRTDVVDNDIPLIRDVCGLDTTASLSSLVVRSRSGICEENIRSSSWLFNVTDIFFNAPLAQISDEWLVISEFLSQR